jgi:adenosylmethionine-8-amino-7-oxononanoate aminotransferase
VLDGTAGLWCVNAGHCRPKIVEAIQPAGGELDYAPAFQMGHPKAFELANRWSTSRPKGMDHVLYTNSGSESVETALKVALAYHRVKGDGSRFRLIGRERGYHGVNFGGISVGGIVTNRKMFGTLLTGVDHMPHTHNRARTPSPAASRSMARPRRPSSSASSRCTTPRPSPPSSSSRSPAPPACSSRPRAICRSCARSAPSTASC